MNEPTRGENPLRRLEDWEDFVEERYPEPGQKAKEDYRNYDKPARDTVCDFYRLNHRHQTYDFVQQKKRQFLPLNRRQMTVLEALDFLDTLVDDSDPDIALSQREHSLQTAEAIRADGHEDWFVLVGLVHDLGKILCLFGEPQWAVGGRHVSGRLRVQRPDRLPRVLRRQSGSPRSPAAIPLRRLRSRMRPAKRPPVLGARRVSLPRHEGPFAGAGALYDALSLLLPLAPRGGIRVPARRPRPPDASLGAEVQPVRSLFEVLGAAQLG